MLCANRKIYDFSSNPLLPRLRRKLRPGDVILTATADDAVRPIVYFQSRFDHFPPASRKFSHAALYIGQDQIVHALPDDGLTGIYSGLVRRDRLADLLKDGTTFTVLRTDLVVPELHEAIADAALAQLGAPYDYGSIHHCLAEALGVGTVYSVVANLWRSLPELRRAETARSFICSDLVYCVFDELFQERNPCNYPGGHVVPVFTPCALFASPNFSDVDLDDEGRAD